MDRVAIFYGAEDKTSALLQRLIEKGLEQIQGEIIYEVSFKDFFCVEDLIEEKSIDYIFFAEKPLDVFMSLVNRLFQTRIKGYYDVQSQNFTDNSFLNRDAMSKSLDAQWDAYMKKNQLIQGGNRVAIYHMSLDPIRKGCIDLNMKIMRSFAQEKGWTIAGEYLDMTNAVSKKTEFARLQSDIENYDIILLKNCYYISRKTNEYVRFRNEMFRKNKAIYSMNEGWC